MTGHRGKSIERKVYTKRRSEMEEQQMDKMEHLSQELEKIDEISNTMAADKQVYVVTILVIIVILIAVIALMG